MGSTPSRVSVAFVAPVTPQTLLEHYAVRLQVIRRDLRELEDTAVIVLAADNPSMQFSRTDIPVVVRRWRDGKSYGACNEILSRYASRLIDETDNVRKVAALA